MTGIGNSRPSLAAVFHQWVDLCTFHPDKTGDYYLQVRTNAPLRRHDAETVTRGDPVVYTGNPSGLRTRGTTRTDEERTRTRYGRLSIRLRQAASQLNADVSVAGFERMPVYQNATASTALFNLLQVKPDAAGKDFYFSFFDAGDASG